jgi:hypothetical protein
MIVNRVFHAEILKYLFSTTVLLNGLFRVDGSKNHVVLARDNKRSHSTQKKIELINVVAFLVNFLSQAEVLRL